MERCERAELKMPKCICYAHAQACTHARTHARTRALTHTQARTYAQNERVIYIHGTSGVSQRRTLQHFAAQCKKSKLHFVNSFD